MTLDPWFLAVAVPAALIAGVAKGGFGGAGAIAAVPLLALAIPPAQAAGVMLPLLMLMDVMGFLPYWRRWSWAEAWPLMAAATLGTAVGWAVFDSVSPPVIQIMIGAVALLFVVWRLLTLRGWSPGRLSGGGAVSTAFWGVAAGFSSFVAHAGGPPVAIALVRKNLDKTVFQATNLLVFWWINVTKLGPYVALGLIDASNLGLSAQMAIPSAIGVALGVWAHRRVSQRLYDGIILTMLVVSGGKLVWDGVAAL